MNDESEIEELRRHLADAARRNSELVSQLDKATSALRFFANLRERIYVMQEEQQLAACIEREAAKAIEALKEPSECN